MEITIILHALHCYVFGTHHTCRLEDLIAFVDLYHLAYPDEGAEHPENTSQEVTDEERSDHKVNMFLNEIGLKGTVQLKRSTSTS
jgi:hypothetical protein